MSIHGLIREWKIDGQLSPVQRIMESGPRIRCVLATDEVQKVLSGPWETKEREDRFNRVKAIIDLFISGEVLAIREPPSKSARAQMAFLEPISNAVWAFRTPQPRAKRDRQRGVRVFGMFADRDLFIAFSAEFRENLEPEGEFLREIEHCKREWRKFFTPYSAYLGDRADDYLSKYISI